MIYRELGNTGLKVSQLGFGAMRLPMVGEGPAAYIDREKAIPIIHRALEAGVNYIDTAVFYSNNDSQRAVGDAIALWGRREQLVISTKNHYFGEDEREWWKNLEQSLVRLRVSYIDLYNFHGLSWKGYQENVVGRGMGKWMEKAHKQGIIRHICNSFHDNNDALRKIVDTGFTASVTVQYNMLDRQLEDGIAYARSKGVGVVVMGPVAGGRLGATSDVLARLVPGVTHVPELALRFVLSNPNVTVALSGMSSLEQVEQNVATAASEVTLSDQENAAIREHLERLKAVADSFCTGCRYCLPCPQEVNIPSIFDKYNWGRAYGLWDPARAGYENISKVSWEPGKRADACIECGACEKKCPQHLPIMKQLKEAHEALKGGG